MNNVKVFFILMFCISGIYAQDEIWMRPNRGQWHENISYKIGIPAGQLYLEKQGFTYDFSDVQNHYDHGHGHIDEPESIHHHVVKTTFVGAQTPTYKELNPSPFYENYFLTNDQNSWVSNSHAFSEVVYQNLYNKINLRLHGTHQTLKYDIIVAPGETRRTLKSYMQDKINWQ